AYGFFVDFVRRQGAEKYFGTDISADAIAYAKKNFGHHFDTFTTEVRPPFSYNFMAAWDVWEHMESPYDFFSDVARSLPTGGILAMTTIDSSSFVARFRGLRWRQVHPPTHMHYPTKKALASALKRMNFEIIHHGHYGYYRSLESYLDALKISFLMKLLPRLRHFPIVLDLKDEQFLIARKL
ncbi:MAG: class I SAM-dependent methyltransferase, partial [Pseudobdellovibrionaceae bacterium]